MDLPSALSALTLTLLRLTPAGTVTLPLIVAPLASEALMPVTSWAAVTVTGFAVSGVAALLYHWVSAPLLLPVNWSL
ncbi:hypothetical protein D9M72_554000 [compost metagenome]